MQKMGFSTSQVEHRLFIPNVNVYPYVGASSAEARAVIIYRF